MNTPSIALQRPLGPLIGKVELGEEFVKYLNEKLHDKLQDYSDYLVGKVSEELKFDDAMGREVIERLSPYFLAYHYEHHPEDNKEDMDIILSAGWYVRQFENEYNPLHVHTNCSISCVGYLALPKNIEAEWEEDEKDHHPANGRIEFAYATSGLTYTKGSIRIKPKVGDFYIFPNSLWHTVYPFKTKGERRSFSLNIIMKRSVSSA